MTASVRSPERRLRAALLWAGEGAAASGRSAAVLYRLEGVRSVVPEIVIHRPSTPARRGSDRAPSPVGGGTHGSTGSWHPGHRRRVHADRSRDRARAKKRSRSPVKTLAGEGSRRSPRSAATSIATAPPDDTALAGSVSSSMTSTRSMRRDRPWRSKHAVCSSRAGSPVSCGSSRSSGTVASYRFDFAFPDARTILETNGRRWHDDPSDYEHDQREVERSRSTRVPRRLRDVGQGHAPGRRPGE